MLPTSERTTVDDVVIEESGTLSARHRQAFGDIAAH